MSCKKRCGKRDCCDCNGQSSVGPKGARGATGSTGPTGPCCTGPTGPTGLGANNFIQSGFGRVTSGTQVTPLIETTVASTSLNFPVASFAEIISTFAYTAPAGGTHFFALYVDNVQVRSIADATIGTEPSSGALQERLLLPAGIHLFELRVFSTTATQFPAGVGDATIYVQETLT